MPTTFYIDDKDCTISEEEESAMYARHDERMAESRRRNDFRNRCMIAVEEGNRIRNSL